MREFKQSVVKGMIFMLCLLCSATFLFNLAGVACGEYMKYETGDLNFNVESLMIDDAETYARNVCYTLSHNMKAIENVDAINENIERTNFIYELSDNHGNTCTNMVDGDKFSTMLDGSEILKESFLERLTLNDNSEYEGGFYCFDTKEAEEYINHLKSFYNDVEYRTEKVKINFDDYSSNYEWRFWYGNIFNTQLTDFEEAIELGEEEGVPKSIIKTDSNGNKYFEAYKLFLKTDFKMKNSFYYGWKHSFSVRDEFYYIDWFGKTVLANETKTVVVTIVSFFIGLLLYTYLVKTAVRRDEDGNFQLSLFDKIPLEFLLALFSAVIIGIPLLIDFSDSFGDNLELVVIVVFLGVLLALAAIISLSVTISARIKSKTLFKSFLIYILISGFFKFIKKLSRWFMSLMERLSFYGISFLYLAIVFGFDFLISMIFLSMGFNDEFEIFLYLFLKFCLYVFMAFIVVQMKKIQNGINEISTGNLEYKINTAYMLPPFKKIAQRLNEIGKGMDLAIDDKVKSERLKAELITNVSHDIKTPLTSIINYVDILKREGLGSPNASSYLEVIDRQSARLKKLTEDLVEASKANTGNINVIITDVNVNVLLAQVVGEYSEKFEAGDLEPVVTLSEADPIIKADGNLLWRIFDNLLSNICKYSKSGTRVYLETACVGDKVTMTFKNISNQSLNIPGDELMERFVRGDSSRNTEGSGLGLSIAKSFAVLQNADFRIDIDGDLFKSIISFDK